MNTPENQARAIFLEAIEQPPERRAEFVAGACGENLELRAQVEQLLRSHEQLGSFHDAPPADATIGQPVQERSGTQIGPYKLLQQIGEGGMGTVYMAEQTHPVQRKVALKLIKAGMDSRQVIARFEAERQALAMMDHVNIARVLDAGTVGVPALAGFSEPEDRLKAELQQGRPYFVMELVHGVPITKYCDDNHLTPRERLELFVPVCQAIQHAHQKGIIHRDIKPSNVMVTLYDGKPVPKVIDFGVAKATEQKLTERTLFTQYGTMVGTLEYMSPEQAEMSALGVDTRSDIYSLGVLLYELLTGSTPLTHQRMKEAAYAEILRMIKEEEPPKPSTRLSDSGEALASISANRHTEPAKLTKLVKGELDWIVMKTLEKDRNRRYETANGFAQDVQRYLNDETVQACPPSVGYRFRKFARRNKAALVMASVIGVALLLAVGSLGWVVRDRDAGRVRTAREVNQFLQRADVLYADNKLPEAVAEVQKARGVLEAGSGDEGLERRVRQWLTDLDTAARLEEIRLESYDLEDRDRAYADYARAFRDYGIDVEAVPAEEATTRVAASHIKLDLVLALSGWASQLRLDAWPQDPTRWQRLLAIARAADPEPWQVRYLGAHEARDVRTLRELADGAELGRLRTRTLAGLGNSLRAAGDAEAAVAFLRKAQRQHPADFSINSNLARCLGELKPPPLDEVIAFRRVALAVRPRSAWSHNVLGFALKNKGRLDEAIVEYRDAIRLNPDFVVAHTLLGTALLDQKKLDEAIACFRKAIELDPNYAPAHNDLGNALREQKKLGDAVACYKKAIELNPNSVWAHYNLGNVLHDQKKLDEAIVSYSRAIELDPKHARARYGLGIVLFDQQKLDGAIVSYRKAIELDPKYARAHTNLGNALKQKGLLDDAIAEYKEAIRLDPEGDVAHNNLGNCLKQKGQLDEAIAEHKEAVRLNPMAPVWHKNLGNDFTAKGLLDDAIAEYKEAIRLRPDYKDAYHDLGDAYRRKGLLDEAIAAYREAIRLKPDFAMAHCALCEALGKQGLLDEAIACGRKAIELDPKLANAHYNLGDAHFDLKKLDVAIACYRKAIELDPKHDMAYGGLGLCYINQGQLDEAIACFRKAIELDPQDTSFHNNLGLALARKGLVADAIASYREAIRREPDFIPAHRNWAWLVAAGPDREYWDGKRAVELITRAGTLGVKDARYWRILGAAHYRAGNWEESLAALQKSMEVSKGGDSTDWLFLAMVNWQLGNKDAARTWYDKTVEWMEKTVTKNEELRRFQMEASELTGLGKMKD